MRVEDQAKSVPTTGVEPRTRGGKRPDEDDTESACYSRSLPRREGTQEGMREGMKVSSSPEFDRERYRATARLLRVIRHGLATPLNGAALHLEVAGRRLVADEGVDVKKILENVRMGQSEVQA